MVALGIEEPKQRPPAEFPPFAPEERDSVISKMLGKTMGGLQYVAETLDKPGRAARGLLAGKPYELLNLIPFSDTMGITDPAEAVSGRDLLEKAGAIRPNQPGLDFGDVAGFLGEIALDPLTYMGIGPLTQAGKTAAKAGILAPRLSQGLRSGQRAMLSVGAPKLGIPEKFIGTGADAAAFAEKNIDPLTDYLKYGNPVGRGLRAMFDNSTIGLHGEVSQKLAAEMDPVFRKEQYDATIGNLLERNKLSKPDPQRGWMLDDDHGRAMLYGAEFATKPAEKAKFISQMAGGDAARHATLTQAADMGSNLRQQLTNKIPELNDIGLEGKELTDIIDYMYRQHSPGEWPNVLQKLQDSFRVKREEFARLPFLKGFPGGTNQVNDLLRDPAVLTGDPKSAVQYVSSIIDADPEEAAARAVKFVQFARKQTPPQIMQGLEQAVATGTNTDQWTQQLPAFFNVDPITNTIVRQGKHVQQMHYAQFKHELVRRTAQQFADPQAAADAGYTSVESALQKAGLTFNEAVETQPGQFASRGAHATAATNLGLDPSVLEDVQVPHSGGIATYKRPAGLGNYYIPNEIAADMKRVGEVWETPKAVAPILNAYDALLNFWKMSSTQVWPAFHARNLISGLYYQLVSGNHYPGARGMVDNIGDAYKVLFGQDIDPARLQMLGASSAGELQARAMAAGIIRPHGTQATDVVGDAAGEFIDSNPYRQGAGEWAKQNLGGPARGVQSAMGAARKLDPRGVAQGVADTAASSALAGRATGNVSEDLLRMAHWLGAKANGYDDLAAGMEVKKWLFDYGDLTQFEKSVMKRVFPFFSFTRKNLPLVVNELIKSPGGSMAQTIRAANEPRQGGGFVPQHISEGVAIPVPGGDGSRFITSLGLPFESAFDPFQVSPTIGATLQRNLEGVISQTNPLIKGGYTLASQREPFSGRPLEELYPYPSGSPTYNAIHNSFMGTPTSRVRTLFDERKSPALRALNMLTGVKVSDVSGGIENARQLAARKINERIMREDPSIKEFTRYYVPPGMEGMITPEQVENLRLQETLTREARANAKRRAGVVGAGSL